MFNSSNAPSIFLVASAAAALVVAAVLTVLIVGGDRPDTIRSSGSDVVVQLVTPEQIRALGFDVLPDVVMPPDNPATADKIELGKILFFDPRMSANASISCASCHQPTQGWGDNIALNFGYPGTPHWRNSQTILNSVFHPKLFWAGESLSLEKQAKSAWTGATAQNLDTVLAEERLFQMPDYVARFNNVFGPGAPSFDNALRAVAAFESTIVSQNVPFDNYIAGDEAAVSDAALRGFDIFSGKAGCSACHSGALYTDESFHALGIAQPAAFVEDPLRQITFYYQNLKRGVTEEDYRAAEGDLGLYYKTKLDEDRYKFRTATLREVGQTGPYMHNGAFNTLEEVVGFYNTGGGNGANKSELMKPLGLDADEISDLVAFLESLTGDVVNIAVPELPEYEVIN